MDVLVSLVGAGPGDPALLTLAAVRALARADVVLYDARVHPGVLAYAAEKAALIAVGKRAGHPSPPQQEVTALILAHARSGKRVCRLKGGDPLVFGRGADEAAALANAGIAFEIVPGVSAALGATAYAGIPLTDGPAAATVALVAGGEADPGAALGADTVVLFMAARRVREEMSRLIAHGRAPDTPAAAIASGTLASQRVVVATVRTLGDACDEAGLTAPALLVVGRVVDRRAALAWWDRRPLFGRRVVVTRARSQAAPLLAELVERGAEPWPFPAIAFAAPTDPAPLERAAASLDRYAIVTFTSANGVARLFEALAHAGRDARAFGAARVVAIGPATADALRARGIVPDAVPEEHLGEAVADAALGLLGADPAGARVLVARAEIARDALPARLRDAGCAVDVVAAYRTVPAGDGDTDALRAALRDGTVDAMLFTSASTVEHTCNALGADVAALLAPVVIASIGPITSAAARARGLHVTVEAARYTVAGLLDALETHFASHVTS